MKKQLYIYIALLLSVAIVSCEQFESGRSVGEIDSFTATVSVTLDIGDAPVPSSLDVKLINYAERYELEATMSADGTISVENIIPGIYTVMVGAEVNADGFSYHYSGSLVNVDIISNNKSLDVKVVASKSGALLFKEVYYCGSRTPSNGSYFRDQFYEIYNNSEVVQNVRNLAIAILHPLTATANRPIWPGDLADNYVFGTTIWQVPDDRDYPVNPGESIIIAQMADNHQREGLNPNSPVNLISAEFETLVNTTAIILDNPAINMKMAFWERATPQWLTTVFGGHFVIYFPQIEVDINNAEEVVSPVGLTSKHFKIPIADVVDAIELVGNENQMQLKRMPSVLDAGAVTVGATYVAKSVARKIKETTEDGRIILMDTNNSTNDFEVMDPPMIRRYGISAPSWNTWK